MEIKSKGRLLLESTENYDISKNRKILEYYQKIDAHSGIPEYKKEMLKILIRNNAATFDNLKKILAESLTTSAAIAPLETYIFPLMIRAMVRTFADQLVSVQPVQSTLAQVRILKTRYGTGKGAISEADYGLMTFGSRGIKFSPYYTSPYVDGEEFSGTVSVDGTFNYTLKFPSVGKINIYITYRVGTNEPVSKTISLAKGETYTLEGSGTTVFTVLFKDNDILAFSNSLGPGNDITISKCVLTYTTNLEANKSVNLNISLEKIPISVEIRRLFSAATIESILELAAHQVDWKELVGEVLAAELAVELDRSIIQDIIAKTLSEGYVSTFVADLPATWDRPVGEYIKNLYYAIQQANAEIYNRTRRIPGNWIVCSAKTAAALEAANYVVMSENYLDEYAGLGFFPLGVLRGLRNKIFVDVSRSFPENMILVGAKGESPYDSGYVYAPYAPAIPILTNIMDIEVPGGVIYTGIYQAAGFAMIDNGFYHVIRIEGDLSTLYATYA
ncbi:MAG: hypothetical protein QXO40_05775 [Candidatus Aenigmatarchaeota archaeon]